MFNDKFSIPILCVLFLPKRLVGATGCGARTLGTRANPGVLAPPPLLPQRTPADPPVTFYATLWSTGLNPAYSYSSQWRLCEGFSNVDGEKGAAAYDAVGKCTSAQQRLAQSFTVIAAASLAIAMILMPLSESRRAVTICVILFTALGAASSVIVIADYWSSMSPLRLKGTDSFCNYIVQPANSTCRQHQGFGAWFQVATLIASFISMAFFVVGFILDNRRGNGGKWPSPPPLFPSFLVASYVKIVFYCTTFIGIFLAYTKVKTLSKENVIDNTVASTQFIEYVNSYTLWTSGEVCQDTTIGSARSLVANQGLNLTPADTFVYGDCSTNVLHFIRALAAIAVCFAGLSSVSTIPDIPANLVILRISLGATVIATACLIVVSTVWITGMNPGRGATADRTCSDIGIFTSCSFSWYAGIIVTYVALGMGAVSFICDTILLTKEGGTFCCGCTEVEEIGAKSEDEPGDEESPKMASSEDEEVEDNKSISRTHSARISLSEMNEVASESGLDVTITKVDQAASADSDPPQSPYIRPASPLGSLKNWWKGEGEPTP